ncbi:MAG: host attachment protein [Nitrospiraceae bacterium]|nr:MAG: host attachment protein [Nitrospiraceae bacterium]
MDKKIIIIADLGHFKAYRITQEPRQPSPKVTLIESYDSIEGHGKLGDKLSDAGGRFRRSGGKDEVAKGSGERHNIELELEKKVSKMLAMDIDALIEREGCNEWYLASGKKINRKIIDNLKPAVKNRLIKNITADLTGIGKAEILNHFK